MLHQVLVNAFGHDHFPVHGMPVETDLAYNGTAMCFGLKPSRFLRKKTKPFLQSIKLYMPKRCFTMTYVL